MIIPLLLALASADIKCPVKISVTGWLKPGAEIRVIFNGIYHSPSSYTMFASKLPFDTTIYVPTCTKCRTGWEGIATTVKGVEMRVSTSKGSVVNVACDDSWEYCDGNGEDVSISDECRLR